MIWDVLKKLFTWTPLEPDVQCPFEDRMPFPPAQDEIEELYTTLGGESGSA